MPYGGNMKRKVEAVYGEELAVVIPRLIEEFGTPELVARHLGIYANSVRVWLLKNNYRYVNGSWAKLETETDHA